MDNLKGHRFVYESGYYQDVIRRAKLDNPTAMTSKLGTPITIQNACLGDSFVWCQLMTDYLAPNLERRTGGAVRIHSASFQELGVGGPETLSFLIDGTLDMANLFSPHLTGVFPEFEILHLYGLYTDRSEQYQAMVQMLPHFEHLLTGVTEGYPINVNWHSGNDVYLLTRSPLQDPEDFHDIKARSISASLTNWLIGMGAEPFSLANAEVFIALERQIIDAAASTADNARQREWYEVTNYINGPVVSWTASYNVINGEIWESIPKDLQEIIKEEAAKLELEALRVAAIHNETGLQKILDTGITYVEFDPEIREQSSRAARSTVIPKWVKRVGGPSSPFVEIFNRIHDPILGIRIEYDGSVEKLR